jgi:nucleoside-diphosphate-sugar epimerase
VKPRTVAVTGATGFLGLHLVAALARQGAAIRLLARRDPTHEFWSGIGFETISGSLEEPAALERLVTGADAIVHAAGMIKARDRAAFLRGNRDGADALARAARRHAPGARFIAVSTLAARDPAVSGYAFSKHAGEEAVRAAYTEAPAQLTIIRPPALYGPWDKATLPLFAAAALPVVPVLRRGRLSILHVADAAASLARLAVGTGISGLFALPAAHYEFDEIMATAAQARGCAGHLLHVPAACLRAAGAASSLWGWLRREPPVFGLGKAREILHPDCVVHAHEMLPGADYAPQINLAEGFATTVAWYREHHWLR